MFFELTRRPKGVNIDDEEQVAVTLMSSAVSDTVSWRRKVHLVGGRLSTLGQPAAIFTVFIFICIFCMTCARVSPHQLVQKPEVLCSSLLPLWSCSCCTLYGAIPAYRTWLWRQISFSHNWASFLSECIVFLLMGTQGELIRKHLWLRRPKARSKTGSKAKRQRYHTVPSPAKAELCFKR